MKKAKFLPIAIATIILVVFVTISFLIYDASQEVAVVGVRGTYAEAFANDNDLIFVELYDSENDNVAIPKTAEQLKQEAEQLAKAKKENNPESYTVKKGDTLWAIATSYFGSGQKYKDIQDSNDIPDADKIYEGQEFEIPGYYVETSSTDQTEETTVPVRKYKENGTFSYNYEGETVNVTYYKGYSPVVFVPDTIDGLPVKKLSMDVLNSGIVAVYIPESVTTIDSQFNSSRYTIEFLTALLIMLVGYIFAIVATFIGMKRSETAKGTFYGVSFVYGGMVTYIVLAVWCGLSILFGIKPLIQIIVALIILAIALTRLLMRSVARELIEDKDAQIKEKTLFVKMLTVDADSVMARAKSDAVKTEAKRVYEAIRYSDPMSSDALAGVESQITLKFDSFAQSVDDDDAELAKANADELLILINDRNKKCKILK